VAVVALKWTADYIKGTGVLPGGYIRLMFEDGFTIDFTAPVKAQPDSKGKGSLFEGTSVIYQERER